MAVLLLMKVCCFLVVLFHPSMQMRRNATGNVVVNWPWQYPLSPINEQFVNASEAFIQYVNLGDVLIFRCPNGSFANLFYLEDLGQYNACECSASSGRCLKQGECLGEELDLIVRVTEGSEFLASVIPFASNKNFYFTSFSDGVVQGDSTSNREKDGRCLSGLKIIIHVNESTPDPLSVVETSSVVEPLPTLSPTPAVNSTNGPGGNTDGTGDGGNVGVTEDPSDVVDLTLDDVNQTLANVSGINHATNLGCSQLLTYYISVVTCALLAVALRY